MSLLSAPESLCFIDVPGLTCRKERLTKAERPARDAWFTPALRQLRKDFCKRWGVANPAEATLRNPLAMDEWLEAVAALRAEV